MGYGPAPKDAVFLKRDCDRLELRYSPDQPRAPAGSPDGGQWTSGGGGGSSGSSSDDVALNIDRYPGRTVDPKITRVQDRGYDIDLIEDEGDLHRGHTIRDHVGKNDENLTERSHRNRVRVGPYGFWKPRIGTFHSLATANKLVNSTLSQNQNLVEDVVSGKRVDAVLEAWFKTPTGKEAYAPKFNSSVVIRETFGVRVLIKRDSKSRKGFRIFTAFPINPN